MVPKGGMTTINAEVPMAEILTFTQSLASITAGRTMHFLRYEEVTTHITQKVMEAFKGTEEKREESPAGSSSPEPRVTR